MVVTAPPRDGCIPPEMASRSSAPDGSARTCHKSEENISHLCQKRPLAMVLVIVVNGVLATASCSAAGTTAMSQAPLKKGFCDAQGRYSQASVHADGGPELSSRTLPLYQSGIPGHH